MERFPFTKEGYVRLEEELKIRKTTGRGGIIKAIAEAREHGDLSENAEYHAAKELQSANETRIQDLENVIACAEIIDNNQKEIDKVIFGSFVRVIDGETRNEHCYRIVGQFESDVEHGKLSVTSPTARALIGKCVGESVDVETPGGIKEYEILEISPLALYVGS